LRRKGDVWYCCHAVASERDHLERDAFAQLWGEYNEVAIREECNLEVIQSIKVLWQLRERIAREVKHLESVGELENLAGKLDQPAGYQLELLCALIFTRP